MNTVLSGKVMLAGALCALGLAAAAQTAPKRVLVVTVTKGFRHDSIPTAEKVIAQLGADTGTFTVEYARVEPKDPQFKGENGRPDTAKVNKAIEDVLAEKMSPEALKNYDAVIFANTTGNLPLPDKQAFLDWVKSGKGFVGMHSATDTFHGFPGYIDMIGAEFKTHEAQVSVDALNRDQGCPICGHLPADWKVFDEILSVQELRSLHLPRPPLARQAPQQQEPRLLPGLLVQGIRQGPRLLHLAGPS